MGRGAVSGAVELLASLEAAGVRVMLNAAGDGLKVKANSQPPAALLAQIQAARPALLEALRVESAGGAEPSSVLPLPSPSAAPRTHRPKQQKVTPLSPLPEALVQLVRAAAGNHLNRPGSLPSGMVMNLGDYVLATAALYATGQDPQQQLADLWAARGAYAS